MLSPGRSACALTNARASRSAKRFVAAIAVLVVGMIVPAVGHAADMPVPHEPIYWAPAHKGIVITFHGGGWLLTGPTYTQGTDSAARRFQSWGYDVYNVDYGAGAQAVTDAIRAAYWVRVTHPTTPLCLYGVSAGGHLALVAASRVGGIRSVITQGAEFDPADPRLGTTYYSLGWWARQFFGANTDTTDNPDWLAAHGDMPSSVHYLIEHGVTDTTAPYDDAQRFCEYVACDLKSIPPGTVPFIHGYGDSNELAAMKYAEAITLGVTMK